MSFLVDADFEKGRWPNSFLQISCFAAYQVPYQTQAFTGLSGFSCQEIQNTRPRVTIENLVFMFSLWSHSLSFVAS